MRSFSQYWPCCVTLFFLTVYSAITGFILHVGIAASTYSVGRILGNRPRPILTQFFSSIYFEGSSTFLMLSLSPALFLSIYFGTLLCRPFDIIRQIRFLLASLTAFIAISGFLLLGLASAVLPFVSLPGGFVQPGPPTPIFNQLVSWFFIVTLLLCFLTFGRLFLLRSRKTEQGAAANP